MWFFSSRNETLRYDPATIDRDLIDFGEKRPTKKTEPGVPSVPIRPEDWTDSNAARAKSGRLIDHVRRAHAKKKLAGKITDEQARLAEERLTKLMESPLWSELFERPFAYFLLACAAVASVAGFFGGPAMGSLAVYGFYRFIFDVPKATRTEDE